MSTTKDINWQQLHKDAGYKKYLRKLTVVAFKAGLEDPNNWQIKIDLRNGSAIVYHVPTLKAAQEEAKQEQQKKSE